MEENNNKELVKIFSKINDNKVSKINIEAECYNVNHIRRGKALVFNHYEFDIPDTEKRDGTEKDCKDVQRTLKDLKFDVVVHNDLIYGAICDKLKAVASEDHSNADCLLVVVMSHGENGKLWAKDQAYPTDKIWSYFSGVQCPTLAGKPKIFFIQACKGGNVDDGVQIQNEKTKVDSVLPSQYSMPCMADFLIMFSTYEGYISWRCPIDGSWFIQTVCDVLQQYGKQKDLLTMLTIVNRKLGINFISNDPDDKTMDKKKQIGVIMCTFTRLFYFK